MRESRDGDVWTRDQQRRLLERVGRARCGPVVEFGPGQVTVYDVAGRATRSFVAVTQALASLSLPHYPLVLMEVLSEQMFQLKRREAMDARANQGVSEGDG